MDQIASMMLYAGWVLLGLAIVLLIFVGILHWIQKPGAGKVRRRDRTKLPAFPDRPFNAEEVSTLEKAALGIGAKPSPATDHAANDEIAEPEPPHPS